MPYYNRLVFRLQIKIRKKSVFFLKNADSGDILLLTAEGE